MCSRRLLKYLMKTQRFLRVLIVTFIQDGQRGERQMLAPKADSKTQAGSLGWRRGYPLLPGLGGWWDSSGGRLSLGPGGAAAGFHFLSLCSVLGWGDQVSRGLGKETLRTPTHPQPHTGTHHRSSHTCTLTRTPGPTPASSRYKCTCSPLPSP